MVNLLDRINHVPLNFFDLTPSGKYAMFNQCLFLVFQAIGILITIIVATPWIVLVLIPIKAIFLVIQRLYLNVSREVQRLYLVSASPVYQHYTESLDGLGVIRAYGHVDRFESNAEKSSTTRPRPSTT
ncbi:hypothetical protein GGF32_005777 [Allomyces javanicus]|nr:hypothetical protein GGF32_005777 [Allomyces javanicus]